MDTKDTSESTTQTPPAGDTAPQPEPVSGSSHNAEPRIAQRSIIRRLAGRWKGIFLTWLLVFPPVAYLIYFLDEPPYEAFSLLQIQPTKENLFSIDARNPTDSKAVEPYLLTQVHLITSDQVLEAALAEDPRIAKLPMIIESKDPRADLRQNLRVEVVDNRTYLIRVALTSRDPAEAAAIVNAVVTAYVGQHNEYHRTANKALHKSLTDELVKLTRDILGKKSELKALVGIGHVDIPRVMVKRVTSKEDDLQIPSLEVVTDEQFARVTDRLLQADLDLIDAQAKLDTAKRRRKASEAWPGDQPAIGGSSNTTADERLRELEAAVEEVKRKRIGYMQYLKKLTVETRFKDRDTLSATMVQQELASLLKMQDVIVQKLEQLNFETKQNVYRITLHDRAAVPKAPMNNNRLQYMAVAPFGVLCLILGVFLTREITATRIAARDATYPASPT